MNMKQIEKHCFNEALKNIKRSKEAETEEASAYAKGKVMALLHVAALIQESEGGQS